MITKNKYDVGNMPIIYQAELEQETEIILQKAKDIGPLRIIGEDGRENILMSWTDYWEKFGCLYTEDKIAEIKAAIKKAAAEEQEP